MAMKDWKIEATNNLFTQWRRKFGFGGVFVSNKKSLAVENNNIEKEGYLASGFVDSLNNEKRKVFKTKSEALRYAKAYMRSN